VYKILSHSVRCCRLYIEKHFGVFFSSQCSYIIVCHTCSLDNFSRLTMVKGRCHIDALFHFLLLNSWCPSLLSRHCQKQLTEVGKSSHSWMLVASFSVTSFYVLSCDISYVVIVTWRVNSCTSQLCNDILCWSLKL